jgi:hypothetical protein
VDDRLFHSGLWIGARWSALHEDKADLERMVAPLNPKRAVLAWLNEQIGKQIRQGFEQAKLLASSGEPLSLSGISRARGHARTDDNLPSDGLLVLIGDTVKLVVEDYGDEIVDDYIPDFHLIPALGVIFIAMTQLIHRQHRRNHEKQNLGRIEMAKSTESGMCGKRPPSTTSSVKSASRRRLMRETRFP